MTIDITKTLKEKGLFVSSETVDGQGQKKITMNLPEGVLSQKQLSEFLAQEYLNQSDYEGKKPLLFEEAPSCFAVVVGRGKLYSGSIDKFNGANEVSFNESYFDPEVPLIYREKESRHILKN